MVGHHGIAIGIHVIGVPEFAEYFALHIHLLTLLHMIEKNVIVLDLEGIDCRILTRYQGIVLGGM